ncbi:MAG: ATP-dependent protease LonB [Candidatus Thermoplasmatota archaeon]|jgi:Lon-like ATP-dependent protease|nr:ATP-dependent protease LonB [Candidatus Thermoplasmatota archaeon]
MDELAEWIKSKGINTTSDIKIPDRLVDQVIGQDQGVEVIKRAAKQKRHVILIGEPGTGKSMLAQSMTDFIPKEELEDIMVFHNPEDANRPKIVTVPAGKGKEITKDYQKRADQEKTERQRSVRILVIFIVIIGLIFSFINYPTTRTINPDPIFFAIMAAAFLYIALNMGPIAREDKTLVPKLLVGHDKEDKAPFIDSTGAQAGALLGDVRHDPFQSGGLETPAHLRVEAGNIHKANKGVLFIDEINTLRIESQQSLLTAMQEKKYTISGQSERSAGALVQTEMVPCDFILVASGNLDALQGMHPALRSRIRGYGYEVYMNTMMDDTEDNREKVMRFVGQEVAKDKKIPAFDYTAIAEVIREAQKRAGRKGKITLRLREMGGLIRIAGDLAVQAASAVVTGDHVIKAKIKARPLEQQIADKHIEANKNYRTFTNEGYSIGIVNGLAVFSAGSGMAEYSGIVMPVAAEVTPAQEKESGKVIATGKLGEIAKEAVQNVSAVIKKYTGQDIANHDVHIQFIGSYEGVEGDSASITIATAVVSAMEGIPVDQSYAMTGSLSIRGQVLPVGGVTAKVEAAIEAGFKNVIVPESNKGDIVLEEVQRAKIQIHVVKTISDVLNLVLASTKSKTSLLSKFDFSISTGQVMVNPS